MIDWLITYGPVNVGISVPPSMKFYKSGVYNPSPYECKFDVLGLHALLAVGYGQTDDGEKYWIVKNSWGQKWGTENGYVYFARGKNACGIEDEPIGILA
uniref:Peptidase C1A papain C-terminal domain-containing protein n=1 Tax=Panagrolaimus sp. PS1159 TaxID=55785 RepID=A0AC35FGT8_9BILA